MPIPDAKYRFTKTKKGKAVRLAIVGRKVVEATPFKKNKGGILKKSGKSQINTLASKVFNA